MRRLLRVARLIDSFSDKLGTLAMYFLMATVVVGFSNVVLRYTGQRIGMRLTSNRFIELQWYLYSLGFLLAFPYILRHNINVRVDFFFGKFTRRTKAWIDLIGHFVALLPYTLLAIYVTWGPLLRSWGRLPSGRFDFSRIERSPDPSGLLRAPIKTVLLAAMIFLLIQAISEIIKLIAYLRSGDVARDLIKEGDAPLRVE